jgi:hypothetical protein
MAAFEDTFTDTAGTALENHTPDTGTGWSLITGSTTVLQIEDNGDKLEAVNSANDGYHCDDQGSADHLTVLRMADIANANPMRDIYACVRLTDHNNLIGWRWYGTGSLGSRVTKIDGGTVTDLITQDGAEANIRHGWVKVEAEGDSIELFHGGTSSSPSWVSQASVTETFNNTETGQGVVKNGGSLLGQEWITYFEADTLGGGGSTVTDTAAITSATASLLGATETGTATDTASLLTAAATLLTASETGQATDTATLTVATATPLAAGETALATDTAAIVAAAATPLTASETVSSGTTVTDTAQITQATASALAALETGVAQDTATLAAGAATVLTPSETGLASGASITSAQATVLAATETGTTLDNAVLVNAQGQPIASVDSAITTASGQIVGVTATPLTASETTGTPVQYLTGTVSIVPVLTATPEVVAALKGSPALTPVLTGTPTIKPH